MKVFFGVVVVLACAIVLTVLHGGSRYVCTVSRIDGELTALSAALETYSQDHGGYPSNAASEDLSPERDLDPATYIASSQLLYRALSGDADGDPRTPLPESHKPYFAFKKDMLRTAPDGTYAVDPWGNAYGYSTLKAMHPENNAGYNSSFDLWSTSGGARAKDRQRWVKNW
ncbi:hypothetical protein ACXR0O_01880 [Verrucomicrobiota bacterium sgz303538]